MEDFVVELMSSAALSSESSEKEFEQELRRMAAGGNGVVEDMPQRRPQEAVRRNDRPRNNAQRLEQIERKQRENGGNDMQVGTHELRPRNERRNDRPRNDSRPKNNNREGRPERRGNNRDRRK